MTDRWMTYSHDEGWSVHATREAAEADAAARLAGMQRETAIDGERPSADIVVCRLVPVSRLDAEADRIADLEYELAVECGEIIPKGWRKPSYYRLVRLVHAETGSEVFREAGTVVWLAGDTDMPIASGTARTLLAAVRAVEGVLRG